MFMIERHPGRLVGNRPVAIYIAGAFSRRAELEAVATRLLRSYRVDVTSRWLSYGECTPPAAAQMDLEDIDAADGLLSFTEGESAGYMTGGRHVEFGYAIARQKWLWIVGERENVFHHVGRVRVFPTVDAWAAEILGARSRRA